MALAACFERLVGEREMLTRSSLDIIVLELFAIDLTIEVTFDNKARDRGGPGAAAACGVLDIDSESDFGVIHRSEGDEDRMVGATVFGGTRLAADSDARDSGLVAGAAWCMDDVVHTISGYLEKGVADAGLVTFIEFLVASRIGAVESDQVRGIEIAAVGDDASQISHLERDNEDLALSDAIRIDSREIPLSAAIPPVIIRSVGDVARGNIRKIDRETLTEAET